MLKVTIIVGIVITALTVGWQVGGPSGSVNQHCNDTRQVRAEHDRNNTVAQLSECAGNSDLVQWKQWLSGRSISTHFHFLDLVELLFGDKPQNKNERHSPSSFL